MSESKLPPSVIGKLERIVGAANVSIKDTDRAAYSRDLWPLGQIWMQHGHVPHPPDAIVWVENEEQIVALLKLANEDKFPVIPFAAGSGVCGGALPISGGVIMDIKRMNRILDLNDATLTVTAEAGIIGQHLEMELNRKGYTMGHFPSSIYCSALGGYLAARSAGQLSAKYGKIEDMAMSMRVVLPNGDIVETRTAPRSAAGPNWDQVFIGSEGTLGVITQGTMRIYPYPESRLFRGFIFHGVHDALESMRLILRAGVVPAAIRLYDELDTILIGSKKEDSVETPIRFEPEEKNLVKTAMHNFFDAFQNIMLGVPKVAGKLAEKVKGKCLMVITFEGRPDMTATELKIAQEICLKNNGIDAGEEPGKRWWENRYNVSYNQSRVFDRGSFVDTIEVATTWDKVEPLYDAVRKAVSPRAFIMAHFSHAYVHGCSIYFSVVSRAKTEEEAVALYREIWDSAMEVTLKAGATVTHHHGVGMHKAAYMVRELGRLADVYQNVKDVIDPNNILNPGKMGLKPFKK
ncbi:MAG: FAD-binding oxidoreductase [bacterium]